VSVDASPFRLGDPRGGLAPAVLCVHGLTGTPYEVRPPAEALAEAGFYCEGPLLPGHGTIHTELQRLPRARWIDAVVAAHDALAERHERVRARPLAGRRARASLAQQRRLRGLVVLAAPLDLGWLVHSGSADPPAGAPASATPAILDPGRARHPATTRCRSAP
jgi:carboxylesterase